MRLRRVALLLRKEFRQGPKNFFFFWALIAPVVISLAVSLAFGSLFSDETSLGVVDQGDSQLVTLLAASPSVKSTDYASVSDLEAAVEQGSVDGGIVLPEGFDAAVHEGEPVEVDFYLWGESLAKDRTLLTTALTKYTRELDGKEAPVTIQTIILGDEQSIPWEDRLLPFIVLMTVFVAGIAFSGTSLLYEKEKKTLDALAVTPTTVGEVFLAKGLLGVILGTFMGVVILIINQALGSQPLLLVLLLFLGSIMAVVVGLLMAAIFKDTMTFFANMKMIGLLLYAPVVIYLFPELPQWIGRIFPTYYLVEPIVEISQQGGGLAEIAPDVIILIVLDLVLVAILALVVRRRKQYAG